MKVVIIGGVAGGATVAARLRRISKDYQIKIFERGPYISFANCGLPYHIGGVIPNRASLLLNTPEAMKNKYDVDVYVNHEVVKILKEEKAILIFNKDTGKEEKETYDKLIISTGSAPIIPPIPGINNSRTMSLWTVPDTDKIKAIIQEKNIKDVAIIGGGFIGVEMMENLVHIGINVTMILRPNQLLNKMDYEMTQPLHKYVASKGVKLLFGKQVKEIKENPDGLELFIDDGSKVEAGLLLCCIGVVPNSQLAKDAGLKTNARGGIIINDMMETSEPDIYALGDVVAVKHFVSQQETMIPLAGPANRQGRMLADLLSGMQKHYQGSLGTMICKVFDMAIASTGLVEKNLIQMGKVLHKDYEFALIGTRSHAGYYPGASVIYLKLLFDKNTQKILGGEGVGFEGIDKHIDIISTAIHCGMKAPELQNLELAYAPPFGSAKSPVNILGYVAENVLNGSVVLLSCKEFYETKDKYQVLDVTEAAERAKMCEEGSIHIPFGQLMKRYEELDPNKPVAVYCAVGLRAYNCARILMNRGFKDVRVITAGIAFQKAYLFKP